MLQAAKKDFIALKAEADKLDITKLVDVPTNLNNLITKVKLLTMKSLKKLKLLKTQNSTH